MGLLSMKAEILMIGTELLLGQIEDTNATHIAQVLAANGINLYQKTTVGDNHDRICGALKNALDRCDVVLCSGGLGPTEDDITRECVSEVLNRPLEYHEDIFRGIEAMFARIRYPVSENNKRQAMVPRGAMVVENPHGTAPGLIVEANRGTVICMPGVPHELHAMLSDQIIPYLRQKFALTGVIHYRVLKVCGVGESKIDEAIGDLIVNQQNPTVGVLAGPAAVRIRIAARASSIEDAVRLIEPVEAEVRRRLPGLIMGVDDDTIERVVNRMLAERQWTLATLETSTGGMIAQRLTAERAGQFVGGRVIPPQRSGEDPPPGTPVDLAREVMLEFSADCGLAALSLSNAGKTLFAFVCPGGEHVFELGRSGRDERAQLRTAIIALEQVRRHLAAGGSVDV